jgi:hypothetical protein
MTARSLQLTLICLAFVAPVVLAVLLQTPWFHYEPTKTRNRGELIRPVVPIAADESARALFADQHHWSVLVRFPADCTGACAERLTLLSRLRQAAGKDMDRVRLVAWVGEGTDPGEPWHAFRAPPGFALALEPGAVALVDPLGNAMLRYRSDADPSDVRKDLAHLLRWSQTGERP